LWLQRFKTAIASKQAIGGDAMPMTIELKVVEIVGNFTSSVAEMTITGSIVGTVPSSGTRDILQFPSGGITVCRGTPVKMSELVSEEQMTESFTIGTMNDPPSFSKTMRYGGTLRSVSGDAFNEVFNELTNLTAPTVGLPARERVLTFVSGNQSIAVHMTEQTTNAF
jgi:hypothetical protein